MTARIVGLATGALLLIAAIASWYVHPAVTAALVAAAVLVMSVWQVFRRRAGIEPLKQSTWVAIVVPLTYAALAVVALNGWIYRISADAGTESGDLQMVVGLTTGVVGMSAAYGYGRVRAQKAQLNEVVEVDLADDEPGVADGDSWFFPQAK
ncbi:hypothetical protein L5G32_04755 [Gordonia sp. HY002]|uniref:hypothetical protein n=1 Tax=Gordonia zhenghanii TaxID=2911516 RepID=UPI001EF0CB2E|nr:hypothetical protein [Gordonia zhenghanii]MCF8569573.1 hypothetical protein [Gordonia zhenghanii]MCF8602906.1 hypothetical protein [Gordonia zhenghanii]